jgi:hypothetical protein
MCRWVSVVVLAMALIAPDVAGAETPADVYSDYATDGVLSCGHSRAALKGVLNDASIYQYGDPLTFVGLKLAVRKQLANGCRREEKAALPIGSAAGGGGGEPTAGPRGEADGGTSSRKTENSDPKDSGSDGERQGEPVITGPTSNVQDGRMILLGIVLLLLTLGSGGWAARRAFSD